MLPIKEDIEKLVLENEKDIDGIKYLLFYNSLNLPKMMVISFSSMGSMNYSRISWFCCSQNTIDDCVFLFLYDKNTQFYQGEKDYKTFKKIIFRSMSHYGIDKNSVYTIGNSMGGTAAIYYATMLGLSGAIVANPQFDIRLSTTHNSASWSRGMRKSGEFKSIDDVLLDVDFLPSLYIEYSSYMPDFISAEKYVDIWKSRGAYLISKYNRTIEHTTSAPTKKQICSTINYFESLKS